MNKDQLSRLQRHRNVRPALADHTPAVADVPAFAALAASYLAQLELLDGAGRPTGAASAGATLSKNTAGTALIARLVKAANALYLLYKAEGNLTEATPLHRRDSDYRNLTQLALATEAAGLNQRMQAHKTNLKKSYNITDDFLAALAADAASFSAQLTAPQLAIDAAKIKGATARVTLSALNNFLRDDLRAGIELLKDTHPQAYQALREASQVDDARRGKQGEKADKTPPVVGFETAPLVAGQGMSRTGKGRAATSQPPKGLSVANAPKQLNLQGPASAEVQVSVTVDPENTTTITSREKGKPNAQSVYASEEYTVVGQVPSQVTYKFRFASRPWQLALDARLADQSQVFRLSNAALGWPDAALAKADEVQVVLNAIAV